MHCACLDLLSLDSAAAWRLRFYRYYIYLPGGVVGAAECVAALEPLCAAHAVGSCCTFRREIFAEISPRSPRSRRFLAAISSRPMRHLGDISAISRRFSLGRLSREAILAATPAERHATRLEAATAAIAADERRAAAIAENARNAKARRVLQHARATRPLEVI